MNVTMKYRAGIAIALSVLAIYGASSLNKFRKLAIGVNNSVADIKTTVEQQRQAIATNLAAIQNLSSVGRSTQLSSDTHLTAIEGKLHNLEDANKSQQQRLERLMGQQVRSTAIPQSTPAAGSKLCGLAAPSVGGVNPQPVVGKAKAQVRLLPYPFTSYFTTASDVDSMSIDAAIAIDDFVSHDVRLDLSDSTFVDTWHSRLHGKVVDGANSKAQMAMTAGGDAGRHSFLKMVHSGYMDTVHGWGNPEFFMSTEHRVTLVPEKLGATATKDLVLTSRHAIAPAGVLPTALVFWYEMPIGGALTVNLVDGAGNVVWSKANAIEPRVGLSPAVVSLREAPASIFSTQKVTVRLSFAGTHESSTITIEDLAATTDLRASAEAMAPELARLNIRLPIFTHHAFPPLGNFGVENVLTAERAAWGARFMGDDPEDPSYWLDAMEKAVGLEFILPNNRTSAGAKVWPIKEMTYPFRFQDGLYRYGFYRIYHDIKEHPGAFGSWERAFGPQLRAALAQADAAGPGTGSALYTHWGAPLPAEDFKKIGGIWPLSQPSVDGLRELSARYYGIRNGKPVPPAERVWTASLYRTLVYSAMRRQVEPRVTLDETGNVVVIERWNDSVTGRVMPGCNLPQKRLQGLTVYVADSAKARVQVDGDEVVSFTRNPADETGRPSITMVDNSTPTLVVDEVDLFQMQGRVVPKDARYFFNKAVGFTGKRAVEIVAGPGDGKLSGEVEWQPAVLDASRTNAFQFAYKKSDPSVRAGLLIEFVNGEQLEVLEDGLKHRGTGVVSSLRPADSTDWTVVTLDYAHLDYSQLGRPGAPTGKVRAVHFLVDGKAGDRVFFDRVAFLRQNPLDDPEDGFLVGGHVDLGDLAHEPHRVVMMRKGGELTETKTTADGYFYFEQKIPRSEVVMVYAIGDAPNSDKFFPEAGRLLQIERNTVEIEIKMSKDYRPADIPGLSKDERGASSTVPGVGRIYKPHSEYVTTGLSTPPEFHMVHAINNLGYIDRERRPENPSGAMRVLLMGVCTTFGHTEEIYHHSATVLEAFLEMRPAGRLQLFLLRETSERLQDRCGRD